MSGAPRWTATTRWTIDARPVLQIGDVEGPPETTFSRIVGVWRLPDGTIAVVDGSVPAVRFFDAQGRYRATFGRRGQGPNEFPDITRAGRTPVGLLWLYSGRQQRITLVGSDAQPRGLVTLETRAAFAAPYGALADGRYLTSSPVTATLAGLPPGSVLQDTQIFSLRTGAEGREVASLPGQLRMVVQFADQTIRYPFLPFSIAPSAAVSADFIALGTGQDAEIAVHGPGAARLIIRWRAQARELSSSLKEQYAAALLAHERPPTHATWRRFLEEARLPPVLPAYDELLADAAGFLWAREYRFDAGTPARWNIFDRSGAWLGQLETPTRLRLTDIGRDYIAGVAQDELGVERVAFYRLRRQQ